MFSYYLKCKKNAECKKPKIEKVKKRKNIAFIKLYGWCY